VVLRAEGADLDRIVVHDVGANTPAARAGLQDGDRILSVNGHENLSLGATWERFHHEGPIRLTVSRPDGVKEMVVQAQALLP